MISPFVNDLHVRGCSLHCVARIQYHGSLWTPIISALSSTWGSEINRNQWPGGGGWERHVLVMSNCGIKHWTLPTIKADETSTFRNFRKFFHIVSHQGILKFAMPPVGKHKSRCKKFNSLRRDPLTIHINTFWYPHLLHSLGWLHHHQSEVACSATQLGYLTTRPSLHTLQ